MNALIIPGYGDDRRYIDLATKGWPERYGIEPEVFVFGWNDEAASFDKKWEVLSSHMEKLGETAIIGVSAGASVTLRCLKEYPEKVKKVVTVCGPVHKDKMNLNTLHDTYPFLEQSLNQLDLSAVETKRVMTMRPLYDNVVNTEAMKLDGAKDYRMFVAHHAFSIGWAFFTKGRQIAEFLGEE